MIPPVVFLAAMVGLTGIACIVASTVRGTVAARLAALAHQWQMRFSPGDPFDLSAQVAARLPIPGAAEVLVRDLIYTQEQDHFRYYFTVEYTSGVLRKRRRRVVAATLAESRQRTGWDRYSSLQLAPDDRRLIQQYEWLKSEIRKSEAGDAEM